VPVFDKRYILAFTKKCYVKQGRKTWARNEMKGFGGNIFWPIEDI
jgi:hypothetical protein